MPAKHTDEGLRVLSGESPIHPKSVHKYLASKFGDAIEDVSDAMRKLAKSLPPSQLAQKAYGLYEKFRPGIPPGKKGGGLVQPSHYLGNTLALPLIDLVASEKQCNFGQDKRNKLPKYCREWGKGLKSVMGSSVPTLLE